MIKQLGCNRALRQFYRTTTLHGFKYLCSKYFWDRVGWLVCCCASASCAGVLCAVLWARFLEVPALITLRDLRVEPQSLRMPMVAVCPSAETIAHLVNQNLITDANETSRLSAIFNFVLRRKSLTDSQVLFLEHLLDINNIALSAALFKIMPPCYSLVRNCRWETRTLPCGDIFHQELTQWGVCCVMRPDKSRLPTTLISHLETTRRLHLGLQCSNETVLYGCEFFTKYSNEEYVVPTSLTPGFGYSALLTLTSFLDSDVEKLFDESCVVTKGYTRSDCLYKCAERLCGCSDPLQNTDSKVSSDLPVCSIASLNCLRQYKHENSSCHCLPPCKMVTTDLALETSPMDAFAYTYDNICTGLNESLAILLSIHIRISGSKMFKVDPTETWITLLSSLGGVFNMFLGVGLFSALEFFISDIHKTANRFATIGGDCSSATYSRPLIEHYTVIRLIAVMLII